MILLSNLSKSTLRPMPNANSLAGPGRAMFILALGPIDMLAWMFCNSTAIWVAKCWTCGSNPRPSLLSSPMIVFSITEPLGILASNPGKVLFYNISCTIHERDCASSGIENTHTLTAALMPISQFRLKSMAMGRTAKPKAYSLTISRLQYTMLRLANLLSHSCFCLALGVPLSLLFLSEGVYPRPLA